MAMLSTNRHERQSVHPWYMRRPPLVSASLRETRFLCLSHYLERDTKSCRMDNATKCCNNTRRSLPASPDRYGTTSIPSIHHPTDQQTNERPRDVQKKIRQIRHLHHPHSHHTENQCKIPQLHQDLPAVFSVRHETYLTSPFWIPPKKKTSSLIHPSEKTGPVIISSRYPSQ